MIVAMSENGVIGDGGAMPWGRAQKSDLLRFRALTLGHTVVMGRKTHDSILQDLKHPLENRKTVVVSRGLVSCFGSVSVMPDPEIALYALAVDREKHFVVGGAQIYALAMPYASQVYVTKIHAICSGDTWFRPKNPFSTPDNKSMGDGWVMVDCDPRPSDGLNQFPYTFEEWRRG